MEQQITLMKEKLDCLRARFADLQLMDVEENVPEDMRVGSVNEDGWVEWRFIDSTITEEEIQALERRFEVELPPLFRAFLRTYHFTELGFQNVELDGEYLGDCRFISMPSMSSGNRLEDLEYQIQCWEPLLAAGYIPFAECEDQQGPVCFDTLGRNSSGDCPVVWFLHDDLHDLGEEKCKTRENLLPYVNQLFDSFENMVTVLCSEPSAQ
ncbi:SMI1/KNR4 family protein [Paenibacillus sp. y28]|uniref:SMI1/KNR4 family protein n=1 Tax=Paenibacillus sp. y28 TaxID=3129110 RepID=UPI003016E61A